MSKSIVKLSDKDVTNLKILFMYLASTLTVDELKDYEKRKRLPPRLRVLRNMLKQVDPNMDLKELLGS